MVYNKVLIVVGQLFTYEDFEELTGFKQDDVIWDRSKPFGLDFLRYVCCSQIGDDCFILGTVIMSYERTHVSCGAHLCDDDECKDGEKCKHRCGNRIVCDNCIGATTNGVYDVSAILDDVIEIKSNHICDACNHDNKRDIYLGQKPCSGCGILHSKKHNITENKSYRETHDCIRRQMKKFDKAFNPDIRYYYMINDCLSCT